jgi:hypothetical protein
VGRAQLPPETRLPITDLPGLISTLDLIDGEHVVVRFDRRNVPDGRPTDVVSLVGELRHQATARCQDHEYAVGTPYAERDPEHVVGGVFFLSQGTFESASLRTFDGNDYFAIIIVTRDLEILVQDSDSGSP